MRLPAPRTLLRHREPALLLDAVERAGGEGLSCTSRGDGPWAWPAMLEGAAQAAGLLAGLQPGGPSNRAVIAEYRRVRVLAPTHVGPLRFVARVDRRILDCWRCHIEARAGDGTVLMDGLVTVAPAAREPA